MAGHEPRAVIDGEQLEQHEAHDTKAQETDHGTLHLRQNGTTRGIGGFRAGSIGVRSRLGCGC